MSHVMENIRIKFDQRLSTKAGFRPITCFGPSHEWIEFTKYLSNTFCSKIYIAPPVEQRHNFQCSDSNVIPRES